MANSSLIDDRREALGCESSAGVYYLGRTRFKVMVLNTVGTEDYFLGGVEEMHKADRDHGFCLNYRGSPTAEESFIVKKTNEGLLMKITGNSDDKSVDIFKTIARAFFVGISGNKDFPATFAKAFGGARVAAGKVFEGDYDPFNPPETALLNNAIKDFGFCLVIDEQLFDSRFEGINDYCDGPLGWNVQISHAINGAAFHPGPLPSVHDDRHGIFYRPRRTHTVYLFIKQDLRRRGGWKLRATQATLLENRSPIMFIGVDRTFFAKRSTELSFDYGALDDITIKKGSEIAGFVQIPLYIAQSIVALPAQILQVRIDETSQRAELIDAQNQLIAAETKLAKLKNPAVASAAEAASQAQPPGSVTKAAVAYCAHYAGDQLEGCNAAQTKCQELHGTDLQSVEACLKESLY